MSKEVSQKQQNEFKTSFAKYLPGISKVLPASMDPNRFFRIAQAAVTSTPSLMKCTVASLCGAIVQSSILGLEVGNGLGHAYLVPYKDQCQLIIGYKGMIDLARRSGQIVSISAQCFYKNDLFEFEFGLNEKLRLIPAKGNRGEFEGVFAIAHLVGGGHQMEVMYAEQINAIRNESVAYKFDRNKISPWHKHYEEMARKTAVRRLFKYLPVSVEAASAANYDDKEHTEGQNNASIIDGECEVPREETKTAAQALVEKMEEPKQKPASADDYEKAKAGVV